MYPSRSDPSPPPLNTVVTDLVSAAAAVRAGRIDTAEDARVLTQAQCYLLAIFLPPGTPTPAPGPSPRVAPPISNEAAALYLETMAKGKVAVTPGAVAIPVTTILAILADIYKAWVLLHGGG